MPCTCRGSGRLFGSGLTAHGSQQLIFMLLLTTPGALAARWMDSACTFSGHALDQKELRPGTAPLLGLALAGASVARCCLAKGP